MTWLKLLTTAAFAVTALASGSPAVAATGAISTVAGTGTAGFNGDNVPATTAQLSIPVQVIAAPTGGFVVADQANYRIRRVAADGTITTMAGSGVAGSLGDGGPATAARLNAASGLAFLPDGSLLIADANNNKIRKVTPGGTISTVVGTGGAGAGGDGGAATSAQLSFPYDIGVYADGSYVVADTDNNRVRYISAGGTIQTFGTTAAAGLNDPAGVALLPDGSVLIADTENHRIRRATAGGAVTTVAGTGTAGYAGDAGPAVAARLNRPTRIAVQSDGGYLISDRNNHVVRRVDPSGTITTLAGVGTPGSTGDGGPATAAQLNQPVGVALDATGDVLIVDTFGHRIRHVDIADGPVTPPPPAPEPPVVPPPAPPPPPPPAPPVARNVTAPSFEITSGKSGSTYRCSDGAWEGLAADPAFVKEIYERSLAFPPGPDRLVVRNKAVYFANTAPRRVLYCRVTARTAAGGVISADGSGRTVPSPFLGGVRLPSVVLTPKRVGDLRIRGIDVLQVVQPNSDAGQYSFEGVPQRPLGFGALCGGGTPTGLVLPGCAANGAATQRAQYRGLMLDAGKRTGVIVYVDRKAGVPLEVPGQQIQVKLRATGARLSASLTQTVTASALGSSPSDAVTATERGDESFGVRFELPQAWLEAAANGTFDLKADVSIAAGSAEVTQCTTSTGILAAVTAPNCVENDTYTLTDVFTRVLPFSGILRTIGLTTPTQTLASLTAPGTVLASARNLLPAGENFQISNYVAQVAIDPATATNARNCPAPAGEGGSARTTRLRRCASAHVTNSVRAWVASGPARDVNASPTDGFHVLVAIHNYQYEGTRREPGASFNTDGVGAWGRSNNQPYLHLNDGASGRPLTAATHELLHAYGAPHAGKNIGGIVGDLSCGGDANGQVGETWPADNRGRLQGVRYDAASGDRVVDAEDVVANTQRPLYDLMSYCGGEADAWLSPRNWNRAFAFAINAEDVVPTTFQVPIRRSARQAQAVPVLPGSGFVVGIVEAGQTRITGLEPANRDHLAPAGDPASPVRVRGLDAAGQTLGEVGARVTTDSESGATTFIAPVPARSAAVEIVENGTVVDRRARGRAPKVALRSPRAGTRVRRSLEVRWRASDADGDRLTATVQFSPDGRRGWRTVFRGASTGRAVVPAQLLRTARAGRVRVRVSDGFDTAEVTSGPIRVDGRPPTATIVRPVGGERSTAAARVVLRGQGVDESGRRLRGRALTWFAGSRRLGTGERLRVRLPAGRVAVRLVVRDASGRQDTASKTVTVEPLALELRTLRAASVAKGARRVTVSVATSVPANLRAGGRTVRVGPKVRRVRLSLPATPAVGLVRVPVRLAPVGGGQALRTTLVILRG